MGNLCSALPEDTTTVISMAEKGEMIKAKSTSYRHDRLQHPSKLRRKLDPAFLTLIPSIISTARNKPSVSNRGILAVYPATSFILAAYHYSKKHKIPFYPYFMDTWVEGRGRKWERAIAEYFEPKVFAAAKFIFVLTPALEAFFAKKYPRFADKIKVLPHSIQHPQIIPSPDPKWQHNGLHVVYTGQVYGPTVDPIHLLLESFKEIEELNPKLTISTPDSEFSLRKNGLTQHKRVQIVRLETEAEVASLQASADILFNPVSFERADKLQIQTLFPTKTIEYLRARRPMIVCGPANTAFVQYARDKGFAHIIDEKSPSKLAECLRAVTESSIDPEIEASAESELNWRSSKNIAHQLISTIG